MTTAEIVLSSDLSAKTLVVAEVFTKEESFQLFRLFVSDLSTDKSETLKRGFDPGPG